MQTTKIRTRNETQKLVLEVLTQMVAVIRRDIEAGTPDASKKDLIPLYQRLDEDALRSMGGLLRVLTMNVEHVLAGAPFDTTE